MKLTKQNTSESVPEKTKAVHYSKSKAKSISELKENQSKQSELEKIEDYLLGKYEFRYNIISNDVEFRILDDADEDNWQILKSPSLWRELTKKHFKISQSNLDNLFASDFVQEFNPFVDYFESLPPWNPENENDYINQMAGYISAKDQTRFYNHFKKHIVRAVACALDDNYFNKHALIFIGKEQNTGKTTWIRSLLPAKLKRYFSEAFEADKDGEIAMSANFIMNLDELASLNKADLKKLKAYFSYATIKRRHPYGKKPIATPRRVSFFGTTNETDFLTDETGSVRWLCFEVDSVDWSYSEETNADDLWRQAYYLYQSGTFDYQLNSEEIRENESVNKAYLTPSPAVDLINKYYIPGTKENHDVFYSAAELLESLIEKTERKAQLNHTTIGKACTTLGFERKSVRMPGNSYPIYGYFLKCRDQSEYLDKVTIQKAENKPTTPTTDD